MSALSELILCEYCGTLSDDCVTHAVTVCRAFDCERELFWNFIIDKFPIEVSSYLHNLPDDQVVETLLGAPLQDVEPPLSEQMYHMFLYRYAVFLYKIRK